MQPRRLAELPPWTLSAHSARRAATPALGPVSSCSADRRCRTDARAERGPTGVRPTATRPGSRDPTATARPGSGLPQGPTTGQVYPCSLPAGRLGTSRGDRRASVSAGFATRTALRDDQSLPPVHRDGGCERRNQPKRASVAACNGRASRSIPRSEHSLACASRPLVNSCARPRSMGYEDRPDPMLCAM
jgi:hypothetical protein